MSFQMPCFKVVSTLSHNCRTDIILDSAGTIFMMLCPRICFRQTKTFSSSSSGQSPKLTNQHQFFRKHVTSSRHSAEATFATPIVINETKTLGQQGAKKPLLPKNMKLQYCNSSPVASTAATINQPSLSYELTETKSKIYASRPLILLFAWMLAKESHLHKYREFWLERGYDVLSLKTSPLALLLPSFGGRANGIHLYNFLANHQPFYDEILVHAFSVGGYQLCEFLNVMEQKCDEESEEIYNSIKGFIIDSCVFPEDAPQGLSRAITKNPLIQPILEKSIDGFLRLTKSFTYDRYMQVSLSLFRNQKKIPGLMLYSANDLVSSMKHNQRMHEGWKTNGTMAEFICWQQSEHVLHYKQHQQEYRNKVEQFVSKLDLKKVSKNS